MELWQNSGFCQFILHKLVFLNTFVFQVGEHFNQSKFMFSEHFSSFSSFMPVLALVEKITNLTGDCEPRNCAENLP